VGFSVALYRRNPLYLDLFPIEFGGMIVYT
jgi:hypothetical protein